MLNRQYRYLAKLGIHVVLIARRWGGEKKKFKSNKIFLRKNRFLKVVISTWDKIN